MAKYSTCSKTSSQYVDRTPTSLKYSTMNYYNTIARSYDELYGSEQLAKYSAAVRTRPKGRVLDVGCGVGLFYGYLLKYLRVEPEIYVGIDISYRSLRELRHRYRSSGIVEVVAADAEYPPLREKPGFTHLYAFTLYACDYGTIKPLLSVIDMSNIEEAAVTLLCRDRRARCPEGFAEAGYLNRVEVLCVKVPPGGFEPPTPRSPGDLQPGALPG